MTVASNVVELLVEALRDARDQSGVAMMRVAATTAINIRQFDIPALFERLMNMFGTVSDRDVLCVALACTFISGQRQAGAHYGSNESLPR